MENNFLFQDNLSGEYFLVCCDDKAEAMKMAQENFDEPKFLGIVSEEYGEAMGVDVY